MSTSSNSSAAAAAPAQPSSVFAAAAPAGGRFTSRSATQWDRCLENGAIKTAYGIVIGGLASIVLFRSGGARLAATGFGAGMGAGMSLLECKQAYSVPRYSNPLLTPAQNAQLSASAICRCGRASCKCGPNCKMTPVGFSSVQNGLVPTFDVEKKDGACCK